MKCTRCGKEMRKVLFDFYKCDVCGLRFIGDKFYAPIDTSNGTIDTNSLIVEWVE